MASQKLNRATKLAIARNDAWARRVNDAAGKRRSRAEPVHAPRRPRRRDSGGGWPSFRNTILRRARLVLKEALAKMRTARAQKARGSPKSLCKADLAWEQARSLAKHARGVLDQARLVDRHLKRGEVDAALRRAAIAGVQFGWLGRELRGSVDQQSLKTEYGRAVRAERVDEFSRNNEMMAELDRELIAREEERPQAIKRVAQTFGVQPKTVQNVAARLRPTRPRKR